MTLPLSVVVLAAGKGTRMRNPLPKVLHPLAGRPLIGHVLDSAGQLEPEALVVVLAPDMEEVATVVRGLAPRARIAIQDPPLGTGHALIAARGLLPTSGTVLVLYGDTPLLTAATARSLVDRQQSQAAAAIVLGIRPPDPSGYGRLRLADGRLVEIVEERHAHDELRRSAACNSGVMAFDAARLPALLDALPLRSEKNEYYLTDTVAEAVARGWPVGAVEGPWQEGQGVNSQRQLAEVGAMLQARLRTALLDGGVIMPAPDTVFLSADSVVEAGAVIEPYVVLGPGVHICAGAVVHAFSHLEGARVGPACSVGPFARLRPGAVLDEAARVGNFVEIKAARLGTGAKVNHLAYVGDADVGAGANIGAGAITCNYDGFGKHRTEIGARAFIGSNSALVAPVKVGEGAIIGAGSTITRDVPAESVAVARATQEAREGMAPELRERLKARSRRREGG
jgi:bifunctional UDP-N-acetylglucosamine pyrophosphorylase/glucosamine-1-phosphate N-acetyltransferase